MTDLHTHILPGMDDGAQTMEDSLAMLKMEAEHGVDTVALTPHFYRNREQVATFLARRAAAWNQLQEATKDQKIPQLVLGAEVAWAPGMADWPELEELCYQGTKTVLVELPTTPWGDNVFHHLYKLESHRGILPMIAHIDRYFSLQSKDNLLRLLDTGYPIQLSAEALLHMRSRRWALDLLKYDDALLISDCHNLTDRKPNLDAGIKKMEKKLGRETTQAIIALTDDALTD